MKVETHTFKNRKIRTSVLNGQVWFCYIDVCNCLCVTKRSTSIPELEDSEKCTQHIETSGGLQPMTMINESGLYTVIFSCKSCLAKTFKKWLVSEVLPSIRSQGFYGIPHPDHIEAYNFYSDKWKPFAYQSPNAAEFVRYWITNLEQRQAKAIDGNLNDALFDAVTVLSQNLNRQGLAFNKHLKLVDQLQELAAKNKDYGSKIFQTELIDLLEDLEATEKERDHLQEIVNRLVKDNDRLVQENQTLQFEVERNKKTTRRSTKRLNKQELLSLKSADPN